MHYALTGNMSVYRVIIPFFLDKKLKFCYNYMESIMQFAVFISEEVSGVET